MDVNDIMIIAIIASILGVIAIYIEYRVMESMNKKKCNDWFVETDFDSEYTDQEIELTKDQKMLIDAMCNTTANMQTTSKQQEETRSENVKNKRRKED